ncbi:regulator of volume decrease after cellular swelling-domain-containing protein [Exophiala viscosa]|uniref:Regulator of volume decrease after cellular swelling-domain-containing protein n=1 Tax=Exophiala viscosa TaxID=2486360 RepID=A0AAN6DZ41_9EURO|nr:regulator of volume decrease after cellular swelling-domain-containing protein [Exophiala viscosa]
MEVLREPPKTTSFVSLAEHQSRTPASFYEGPPVLHYYSDRSKLIILESEIDSAAAFAPLLEKATSQSQVNGSETNGDSEAHRKGKVVEDIDVWVTSDKLFLFSDAASAGIAIPYPSISLHAIQSLPQPSIGEQQGLYMQLITSTDAPQDEDIEPESISVTIIPTASAPPETANENDPAEDKPEQTPVQAMFTALSNCSNLHPDPIDPGDEEDGGASRLFQSGLAFPGASDGGLPPAMPGSGGWITAENMHEFVDENGNFIDNEEEEEGGQDESENLGPGAGTVRPREDEHEDGNGGDLSEDTKWQRTS